MFTKRELELIQESLSTKILDKEKLFEITKDLETSNEIIELNELFNKVTELIMKED